MRFFVEYRQHLLNPHVLKRIIVSEAKETFFMTSSVRYLIYEEEVAHDAGSAGRTITWQMVLCLAQHQLLSNHIITSSQTIKYVHVEARNYWYRTYTYRLLRVQ